MADKENSERRLAAIMFTDMVNYSKLMQQDEAGTLKLLEDQQGIVNTILKDHGGLQIKTIGDAFFSQFDSVLVALNCGIKIQETLREFNATRNVSQKINIRIGIHLGDVEIKDDDAYGDGVNIASRIEPFADAGGICITEDVYHQVMNKTDLNFRPLGKKELKNISYSPEVYKVILPWEDRQHSSGGDYPSEKDRRGKKAKPEEKSSPTPVTSKSEKKNWMPYVLGGLLILVFGFILVNYFGSGGSPGSREARSIAVLPFESMTDQSGTDYFTDGITEDIISALAKIEDLRVIARTSILQYKGTKKSVIEIAKELDVNTILEGSVRRIEGNVRVVAQLIDIKTDDHLWANTYDRKLDDIFEVQSDIAMNIANALEAELSPELTAELASSATQDTRAYENYLKGKEQYSKYTEEGHRQAIKYHNKALELDPNYALAYAELGNAYAQMYNITKEATFKELGFNSVEKALAINPDLAEAFKARGVLHAYTGQLKKSLEDNLKAVNLKPGYTDAISNVGLRYFNFGDLSKSYILFTKASVLDPNHRYRAWYQSIPLFIMNENDSAIKELEKGLEKISDSFELRSILFYHHLNNLDYSKALSMFDEISRVREDEKRILELRGLYHFVRGEQEQGVTMMTEVPYPTEYSQLMLAQAYMKLGQANKGDEILETISLKSQELVDAGSPSYHPYYKLAQVNAIQGNFDNTFSLLEEAIDNGFRGYAHEDNFISWVTNPIFSGPMNPANSREIMLEDSRFIKLQQRMKKVIQRERVEAGFSSS